MSQSVQPISVDPVTLEIVRNNLMATAQGITRRMIRSANSFIVKEMEDCAASILDAEGQLLAEEAGPPIQLNTVGICLKTVLTHCIPADRWKPGDVVVTNDPYAGGESLATTHSNDYMVYSPIFYDDQLVAFAGLMVHHLDIGAMHMGSRGWNKEIFQEGVRLPPMKIVQDGVIDQNVLAIILANSRTPEVLENDLISQLSSVQVAGEDVVKLFRKYGAPAMHACFHALMDYSERATRAEIARIPDGVYCHEEQILDDGAKGGPYWLRLVLTKRGTDITLDLTKSDPQIEGPINSPMSTTLAAIYYALRCVTGADVPTNEGCKRPVTVITAPGTLVNAKAPAAVMQRMVVCHTLVDLVMGALAEVVPERIIADSCGCLYNFAYAIHPATGRIYTFGEVVPGGIGATVGADGINIMACHVTNLHIPPVEAVEIEAPAIFLRREFRKDSGGPGRNRGGVGQVLTYKILAKDPKLHHTSQKSVSLPQGVAGGKPGGAGRWVINEGLPGEYVLPFAIGDIEQLTDGDTVTHYTPGGGGYGDPYEREPARVQADVRAGLVSVEAAARDYGLVIDPATFDVTGSLR
jgi:N-methylhydantoinase B